MDFPLKTYGTCPVCGGKGGDYPAASLDSADSTSNLHTTGNGLLLEEYEGEYMCSLCKRNKQADAESLIAAEKHAEEVKFRQQAGFTNLAT